MQKGEIMEITRRGFLAGLLAAGATIALPVPLAQATQAQVDAAWKQLLDDPWYFEVNGSRTIVEADGKEPEIRSDVFDVDLGRQPTPQSLVDDVEGCYALTVHFEQLAANKLEEVESELEDGEGLDPAERERLERLAKVLNEDGWADWVLLEGEAGLPGFVETVRQWLADPIDGNDIEWLPRNSGAQGQAMAFFESLPRETLAALAVVIVEGEHPGSSYYAAELRKPIDAANAAALGLALPFRFKVEGTNHG